MSHNRYSANGMGASFVIQEIPLWWANPERVQRRILKQGKLAGQPIKLSHKKGCKQGGNDCFHCKIIPCGRTIPCNQCTIKNCYYTPPCFGKSEEE